MKQVNKRNTYWIIAGVINGLTAILHLVAGQLDLVNPMLSSDLTVQIKTEWLSAWHIVTATLFLTSFYLLKFGWKPTKYKNVETIQLIGILYLLFALAFIVCSLIMAVFAPQWVLLLPIGVFVLIGNRKMGNSAT